MVSFICVKEWGGKAYCSLLPLILAVAATGAYWDSLSIPKGAFRSSLMMVLTSACTVKLPAAAERSVVIVFDWWRLTTLIYTVPLALLYTAVASRYGMPLYFSVPKVSQ